MSESVIEQNPSGTSPLTQGSNIPLGWKPSREAPVPVVRCRQIKKDGERCKKWSLRGYDKCIKHAGPGAQMPDGNVSKYAQAVIEAARLRLVDDTDKAIDVLHDLMQPGTSEGIRLKSATEILDRAGIRGGFEIDVDVEVTDNPADTVKARLAKLAEGAAAVKDMRRRSAPTAEADEGDIVDAEIVEDDPDQGTLF